MTPVDFWARVDASGDCWIWTGARSHHARGYESASGYGRVFWAGRSLYAHRVAYELLVGPIPDGMTLDHLCRVHACVNPDHVEPVDRGVNTLRGFSPAAIGARRSTCSRGHPYTPENTYRHRAQRQCRICKRIRSGREAA